jgi:hypothetical protein
MKTQPSCVTDRRSLNKLKRYFGLMLMILKLVYLTLKILEMVG